MIASGGGLGAMWVPADSARAVATVYTVSLLATLPLAAAAAGALVLRRASAASRTLVLRAAVFALVIAYVARHLPMHWFAWTVPAPLAAPLVELGRIQVTSAPIGAAGRIFSFADALVLAYWLGALLVIAPTVAASVVARHRARRAHTLVDPGHVLASVARTLGVRRTVTVYVSERAMVPATWGWLRPVVILPAEARGWSDDVLRIVLTHELAHVRATDWVCGLAARVMCALYWFHPGAWWLARQLEVNAELACDERVIGTGIRRSDYAELLVRAASLLPAARAANAVAFVGTRGTGIRARLAVILDPAHVVRPLARRWSVLAVAGTIAFAVPLSMVRLAPTRGVLTSLMRDARWESRAYAVLGLAQRPDTIGEARSAAERDPSPRVRAWARYALAEYGVTAPARAIRP